MRQASHPELNVIRHAAYLGAEAFGREGAFRFLDKFTTGLRPRVRWTHARCRNAAAAAAPAVGGNVCEIHQAVGTDKSPPPRSGKRTVENRHRESTPRRAPLHLSSAALLPVKGVWILGPVHSHARWR
jgi:hypothetical protein